MVNKQFRFKKNEIWTSSAQFFKISKNEEKKNEVPIEQEIKQKVENEADVRIKKPKLEENDQACIVVTDKQYMLYTKSLWQIWWPRIQNADGETTSALSSCLFPSVYKPIHWSI